MPALPRELPPELRSPVHLPAAKLGAFEVRHVLRDRFEVVTIREQLLTGKAAQAEIRLRKPIRIHELREDGALWIADQPVEVRQHREAMQAMYPRDRVLVGGLGLGIMAGLLAEHPLVRMIDVVEISPEVAELCKPLSAKVRVHVCSLRSYLEAQPTWWWSAAFIDLWRDTSEGAWWEEVFPLRRLIGRKFGVHYATGACQFWAEDIMLGQVGRELMRSSPPHWYYKAGLKLPMTIGRARWFIQNIGSPEWEKRYGKLFPEGEPPD